MRLSSVTIVRSTIVGLVLALAAGGCSPEATPSDDSPSHAVDKAQEQAAQARTGAVLLPAGSAACSIYSPANVAATTGLAFDGTVVHLGEARRVGWSDAYWYVVAATFDVRQWYRGGSAQTFTVEVPVGGSIDPLPPPLRVGTRVLVSGAERGNGSAAKEIIAWGCGYTRYYDDATAAALRTAFS